MKRAIIGLAAVVAMAALPVTADAAKTHAKCHGTAQIDQIGAAFGLNNTIEADFVCNRAVKSFVVKLNKPLDGAGAANGSYANHCKQTGSKSYKCTGHMAKNKHIQTSFATKAKNACSGKKLTVHVTAAKRTFKLRGPC